MFSFQQVDDLLFDEINQQDLLVDLHDHVALNGNINHGDRSSSLTNPSSSTADGLRDDQANKKLIHKEMEKKRRKQMANLYAELRSLLPLEFIKGKRSTSDHMDQAVNYIKYMQENIKLLGVKRDQLKNLISSTNTNESLKNLVIPNTVTVNSSNGGIEILINCCSIQDGFVLSRVLKTLVEEGLNIISCNSTKSNDRLLHAIQSEENNQAQVNPSSLQQRLTGIANDM